MRGRSRDFRAETLLPGVFSGTLCCLNNERRTLRESDTITESEQIAENAGVSSRIFSWLKSDVGLLVLLAIARVALHTATNGQYG